VPSVRFSRDKRGYEYVYLVHTPTRRGKPGRSRVLYWYRTPPGVRIGRKPFDPEVQQMLERQNPGVSFDWEAIIATPVPPPDMTEFWRERRRAEKVARQERRAMEAEEEVPVADDTPAAEDASVELPSFEAAADLPSGVEDEPVDASVVANTVEGAAEADGQILKKRRRRRGGRRRREQPGMVAESGGSEASGSANGAPVADDVSATDAGPDQSDPDD
jgi:hypothetical protein